MHGFVKAERFAKQAIRSRRHTLPTDAVSWAESVIAYCRSEHDAAIAEKCARVRQIKAGVLVSKLRSVCEAVCGIHTHSVARGVTQDGP